MLSCSSRGLTWVIDSGSTSSTPAAAINGLWTFPHSSTFTQHVCVPAEHVTSVRGDESLRRLSDHYSGKLPDAVITAKAYLKLVSSLLPPTQFGQKMKPDLPNDAKQIVMLSHLGARCDSETSSRR